MKYITIAFLVIFVVDFLIIYFQKKNIQKMRRELETVKDDNIDLQNENFALKNELKFFADNRRKADEKIEKLHSGNALDNAIEQLCKH